MTQKFYKGRTNNHLTFVMVDATDFATPESALSAATKIMLHGKLRSSSLVHFVSSGTGSMAGGDIKHVGASATGVYTVALAKADLSDASAAWYDQYIATITGTGAAQQVLVIDGGIDDSYLSNVASYLSNVLSNMSGIVSDIRSGVSDAHSDLASKIGAITVTLSASDISDIASAVVANIPSISASDISDIASAVWAHTTGTRVDSRILVIQSMVSDIRSDVSDMHSDLLVMSGILSDAYSALGAGVQLNASSLSDLRSAITAITATVSASDISDIASAVWANTIGARVDSRVRLIQSDASDIASRITGAVATKSQVASATYALFASDISDIKSGIAGVTASVSASDMSDIASRVDVLLASRLSDILSAAVQTNSRVLLIQSRTSDLASAVALGVTLGASSLSDIRSAITAATFTLSASDISDIASAVKATLASDLSDILSAATAAQNLSASDISDIRSLVATVPDSVLNRNLAGGGSGNTRNVRNALRGLRNRVAVSTNVYRVYQEDDTTTAYSGATSTAAGNPIVSMDPS